MIIDECTNLGNKSIKRVRRLYSYGSLFKKLCSMLFFFLLSVTVVKLSADHMLEQIALVQDVPDSAIKPPRMASIEAQNGNGYIKKGKRCPQGLVKSQPT